MGRYDETSQEFRCKYCVQVYLAILRRGGNSWLKQIMRDTDMERKSVKRHLEHLLTSKRVRHDFFGYKISEVLP